MARDGAHAAKPVAEVVCRFADGTERVVPLAESQPLIAGRAADCALVIRGDGKVSRRHCSIEWRRGKGVVVDLGSRNGILVNGHQVAEASLGPNDEVEVGGALLRVRPLEGTVFEVDMAFCARCGRLISVARDAVPAGASGSLCPPCTAGGGSRPSIAGYTLIREIGAGGMGRVYQARDDRTGSEVALKILAPAQTSRDPEEAVARFMRECKAMAALSHPHVVRLYGSGQHEGFHYVSMEYIDGWDFESLVREGGPLQIGDAVGVMCDVLDALAYAHHEGILHRDVKPSNIYRRGSDGFVKLADFGLARLAEETGLSVRSMSAVGGGSPAFAPPEQLVALDRATPRSDVYCAGSTLWALLTAKLPFMAKSIPQVVVKVLEDRPENPRRHNKKVPPALSKVVLKAMAKDPEKRYASAREMEAALRAAVGR